MEPFWSIRIWELFVSCEALKVGEYEKPPYWTLVAYWRHWSDNGRRYGL
jgi:hypothetical protein